MWDSPILRKTHTKISRLSRLLGGNCTLCSIVIVPLDPPGTLKLPPNHWAPKGTPPPNQSTPFLREAGKRFHLAFSFRSMASRTASRLWTSSALPRRPDVEALVGGIPAGMDPCFWFPDQTETRGCLSGNSDGIEVESVSSGG